MHNLPVLSIKEAKASTGGGITQVSKMPCKTYNLPARYCHVGSKLREQGQREIAMYGQTKIPCGVCYTYGHNWRYENVQRGMEARYQALDHPLWVPAMATLIRKQSPLYFRWHSSGDIQSLEHLRRICEVCALTPATRHWLPTQERKIVARYLTQYGTFPSNLCVRISAVVINSIPATYAGCTERQASMISESPVAGAWNCPAPQQGNACGDCRACWDRSVPLVAYHLH
jgi:hypothetical protein